MIETAYSILCDKCGKAASYHDVFDSIRVARELAVEAGWRTRLTHSEDLCPYCQGYAE